MCVNIVLHKVLGRLVSIKISLAVKSNTPLREMLICVELTSSRQLLQSKPFAPSVCQILITELLIRLGGTELEMYTENALTESSNGLKQKNKKCIYELL